MANVTKLAGLSLLVGTLGIVATATAVHVDVQAIPSSLYADLTWRCVGPFDGGPVASVTGVPGEAGVYTITTPSGGAWKTIDGGDTWTSIDQSDATANSADPHRWIDPANPRRIARTDPQGIAVSLDGGTTWVASHHLPIAEVAHLTPRSTRTEAIVPPRNINGKPVNVSIADPTRPSLIFAGTNDSVYVSFDDGANWDSLRLNLPGVAINDLDSRGNNLVAATQGRSIWELDDISPLRQLSPTSASAAAILFKPADAILVTPESAATPSAAGADLDYFLGASPAGEVTLEIRDSAGRVIHSATSAIANSTDRWLPVMRPLSAAPGHHRVEWNLHVDPPPAQKHRYAQFARALFENTPADPNGPVVLPGTCTVRLIVGGHAYTQPLVVRNDPRVGEAPATLAAQKRQFDLEMKMYDAMQIAHREFLQLARVRAALHPILTSEDPDLALAAGDLDTRLTDIDGSDWTGLVIPDADDEAGEVDEKEGKHPDFVPPKAVSLSKDYDDPTSILGRGFNNVNHPPSFATTSTTIGDMLTKAMNAAAPDSAAVEDYDRSCQDLSGVLDAWREINLQYIPRLNAELAKRKLPALPVTASESTLVCGSKTP